MFAFDVGLRSGDGRCWVSEPDGKMTDISLQKTAETAKRARGRPLSET
jgi:hypothetical protein